MLSQLVLWWKVWEICSFSPSSFKKWQEWSLEVQIWKINNKGPWKITKWQKFTLRIKRFEEFTSLVPTLWNMAVLVPRHSNVENCKSGPWVNQTWQEWSLSEILKNCKFSPSKFQELHYWSLCLVVKPNRTLYVISNPKPNPVHTPYIP